MGQIYAKGNLLYAHLFEESVGPINLNGLAGKVKKARLLSDGSEVFLSRPWNAAQYPDDAFISFDRPEHSSYPLPDKRATVVELTLL